MKQVYLLVLGLLLAVGAAAAERAIVKVTHDLPSARLAETVVVPWAEIARALPGALIQHLTVRDASGHSLPYQVTAIDPGAQDPSGIGGAYGELLFQHDFAAGEQSATFIVEKSDAVAPVFPSKVFARFVPERLDDFAWENDKIAHRTYGPALAALAAPGSHKEVLVTSGIDVWCKRVSYPIVDRWYNKGGEHYHHDEGEGLDMYGVHTSRGCGGTGVWVGGKLYVSRNFETWRVLANGPIRAIFELTYGAWDAAGRQVTETKRFTVDAGHNLDEIESTFTVVGDAASELTVGIGLNKSSADSGQDPVTTLTPVAADGSLTQWIVQKTNGALGTALIVPADAFAGFAEDASNQLVLARVVSGRPLHYYAGAGWSKAGEITTAEAWNAAVAAAVLRARHPLNVTLIP